MLAPSSALVRPPQVIVQGRYHVVRALGAGAQATVFLVFDLALRQWRALKIAAPGLDATWHARFQREAQLMARLSHPHVVKIYDVTTVAGTPALVTELARAGSDAAWMRRHGPLPAALAARVAAQCASALGHAHAEGVLHRDVKPGNVLLHADGGAALADFGIARFTNDGATALTEVGWVLGTLAFMAPEQRRAAEQVTASADVYALGATLFTMCTGRRETELFVCADRPAMLAEIAQPLAELIRACCRYEPGDRIAMSELREALLDVSRRCEPVPPGTPALEDGAMVLPELPPAADAPDEAVEELRARLGPGRPGQLASGLSEEETEDNGSGVVLPYRMPLCDRREAHLPDPWEEDDPTSLPPYVEKLYPRLRPSLAEHEVVGLTRAEPPRPVRRAAPAIVEPPPPAWIPLALGATVMTLLLAVVAVVVAWHEHARGVAVSDARDDLVDLVVEQQSLVQHLDQADVSDDMLSHTRDALERASNRRGAAHLDAAAVARQILDNREGILNAWPDDALRIRRVQGALDAWETAEACRFMCGGD